MAREAQAVLRPLPIDGSSDDCQAIKAPNKCPNHTAVLTQVSTAFFISKLLNSEMVDVLIGP